MIDIETIKLKKAEDLRAMAHSLVDLHPIETNIFTFNTRILDPESSPPEIVNDVSIWEKQSKSIFLYYFVLQQDANLDSAYEKITAAKKNKIGKRAYPRINSPSRYLYVGSSRDFTKRVKEHLGFGYKQTYAGGYPR